MTFQRATSLKSSKARQTSLLISTALAGVIGAAAHAGTVNVDPPVAPATSTPVGTVNAAIITDINTPSTDISVNVKAGAVVTGGDIQLNPSAGKGDGAVVLTNAGSIGTVDSKTNTIIDVSGVVLNGAAANAAKNTANVTNGGTITGAVNVGAFSNFGGTVALKNSGSILGGVAAGALGNITVDNSGTIENSLVASGSGDVALTTTATGAVQSGTVVANAVGTSTSVVAKNTTTTTTKSGNATITQDGNAASADGKTKVSLVAASAVGNATVSASKLAGDVIATVNGGPATQVTEAAAAPAASSTTTNSNSTTVGAGKASVTIASTGDVGAISATSNGTGGVSVAVDGKADSAALTTFSANSDSKQTATYDAKVQLVGATNDAKTTSVGGDATLNVGSAGTITNSATVFTNAGVASAAIDGNIGAGLTVTSAGTNFVHADAQTFDGPTGAQLTSANTDTNTASGKTATVAIGAGGSVGANVVVRGDAGAVVTNSGTIGGASSNNNVTLRSLTSVSSNSFKSATPLDTVAGTVTSSSNSSENSSTFTNVGGPATVNNAATGLIGAKNTGFVTAIRADAVGDVTVVNNGTVRGQTRANSTGSDTTSKNTFDSKSTFDSKTGDSTASQVRTFDQTSAAVGGSVTGTYAGANGSLNFGAVDGSINQSANKASTLTITGSVFGDVSSNAGTGSTSTFTQVQTDNNVFDATAKTSTLNGSLVSKFASASAANGASTVTLTGAQVADGNLGGTPGNIFSNGTTASTVTVTDSKVNGSINSFANGSKFANDFKETYTGAGSDGFVRSGTLLTYTNDSTDVSTATGGASVVSLAGKSVVNAGVNSNGAASSSVTVGTDAKVNGSIFSTVNSSDSTDTFSLTYARDAKTGIVTGTQLDTSTFGAAAVGGDSSIILAGAVDGSLNSFASRGNSLVDVTGTVDGGISSNASGQVEFDSTAREYNGKQGATAIGSFPALPTATKVVSVSKSNNVGGTSNVTVNTAPALQGVGAVGVNGSIDSRGVGGSSVTVTAGSVVAGSVFSASNSTDSSATTTDVSAPGKATTRDTTSTFVSVGKNASITNAGEIRGGANANGLTSASVVNTGSIGDPFFGGASATALGQTVTIVSTDNDLFDSNPATHTTVTTTTIVPVGGAASVSNTAGATIRGGVSVVGATGAVTNNGAINGNVSVGSAVFNGERVDTRVATKTTTVETPAAALFAQTYTIDNNGTMQGVSVNGATVVGFDGADVKTSNITTTVNLNSGSATLGSIVAQQDDKGAFLTNTTVNLNGSGFLGSDATYLSTKSAPSNGLTPVLILSKDAQAADFGTGNVAVQVLGVTSLNKTGTGTFVINGASFEEPSAPLLPSTWTLDVGAFAIKAGEVQLDVDGTFGIKGNVVNDATLVVGRRFTPSIPVTGNSLTNAGPQSILGIDVVQTGNFTQSATGTVVVGLSPALVRNGTLSVNEGASASEILGPVGSGVFIPFFTTAAKAGTASTPSSWAVTGDLSLAGKVQTAISRDSIFTGQESTLLFSYTGTGTVTATVDTNIASKFVTLGLKHDTAAKTVSLAATRVSYATGASNPNAVNAATALDSAIPAIAAAITTDANGGGGFTSVGAIGRTQDIANIVSGLDWRLSAAEASQVFDELSSAEVYGSLSSVHQNVAINSAMDRMTDGRTLSEEAGASLWLSPVGNFAKYGGTDAGASKLKVNSYGGALGVDMGYGGGAFGVGFGYAQHDASARGTAEQGRVRTFSLGAYWTHDFQGGVSASAQFSYGFSKFETNRDLTLLARSITADFKGNEWDGRLRVGYDAVAGGAFTVTPFAELSLRHWSMDGFTEQGGAGIGLDVDAASKTVFNPTLGVNFTMTPAPVGAFALRPYGRLSYTFQGGTGEDRTVQYLGGGNAFTLNGVDPDGYGKIEAGVDATLNDKVGMFFGLGFGFGGQQSVARVQGGISFQF